MDTAGNGRAATPAWARHGPRARVLAGRYPFAAEPLALYLALLDVWDEAYQSTLEDRPDPSRLAGWAVDRVLPRLVKATEAAGPPALAAACAEVVEDGDPGEPLARWLAGDDLPPVERYLARAALTGPLVALGPEAGAACVDDPSPRGGRRCPRCGAPPQLGLRTDAGDGLVSGQRHLVCSRCAHEWSHSASACAHCGEMTGAQRTVYAERRGGPTVRGFQPGDFERRGKKGRPEPTEPAETPDLGEVKEEPSTFPHLRLDACATCSRYLIEVDLGRDPLAVPEVDELAALPLDLYAAEHGLTKTTPNVMGF